MRLFPKINKLAGSQKGDAVVMISVLVAGMVFLVVALMLEKTGRFSGMQESSKQAIESTYKAEEGLEYILYSAKEGSSSENSQNDFELSSVKYTNDGSQVGAYDTTAETLAEAVGNLPSDNLVVISKSKTASGAGEDDKTKRSLFSNLPKSFYNQVSAWQNTAGCYTDNTGGGGGIRYGCDPVSSTDISKTYKYQLVMPLSPLAGDWTNVKYKIIFKCNERAANGCVIKNASARRIISPAPEGCLSNPLRCPMINTDNNKDMFSSAGAAYDGGQTPPPEEPPTCLSDPMPVAFNNGHSDSPRGTLVFSDWFNPAGSLGNLNEQKVMIEFTVEGGAEETDLFQDEGGIVTCRGDNSYQNMRAGVFKVIAKKITN